MKRGLLLLGLLGLAAVITWLAVARKLSENRATRLEQALAQTEARLAQLEADVEAANDQIAQLKHSRELDGASARLGSPTTPKAASIKAGADNSPAGPAPAFSLASGRGPGIPAPVRADLVTLPVPAVTLTGPLVPYVVAPAQDGANWVRIVGTSALRDWQVESRIIGGGAELGPGLPVRPGDRVRPGTVNARLNTFIPVRSLKSVQPDGGHFSDRLDETLYLLLRASSFPQITYTLSTLRREDRPDDESTSYRYESTGELCVAGKTNVIAMPVFVTPSPDGRLHFAGSVRVKISDFKIKPPAPVVSGTPNQTGDDLTLSFAWLVQRSGRLSAKSN